MKKNILISTEFFPPAYKAGGPIKSVYNFVKQLQKKYNIFIVASSKDLMSTKNLDVLAINSWIKKDNLNVIYVDGLIPQFYNMFQIIKQKKINYCYVSSFFNYKFSFIVFLLCIFLKIPLMIAPKGELFEGALSQKQIKKKFYLYVFKILKGFVKLSWHATSIYEKKVIDHIFLKGENIKVCSNIVKIPKKRKIKINSKKIVGKIKIIIANRISPVKNLINVVKSLHNIKGKVYIDIFGEIDDENYWKTCKENILTLPNNINITYRGAFKPEDLVSQYSKYDILLMPSFSENFGYSIFEALNNGLPVVIGQNNPWKNIKRKKIGFNVNPYNVKVISRCIQHYLDLSEEDFIPIRDNCMLYTNKFILRKNEKAKKIISSNFFMKN